MKIENKIAQLSAQCREQQAEAQRLDAASRQTWSGWGLAYVDINL